MMSDDANSRARAASGTGLSQAEPVSRLGPSGFDPSRLAQYHEGYGPCDGYGPLWTCSACTGLIARANGTFCSIFDEEISADEAADIMGDYLIRRAQEAAYAAWGCCDTPGGFDGFIRSALLDTFPGRPWRDSGHVCAGNTSPERVSKTQDSEHEQR